MVRHGVPGNEFRPLESGVLPECVAEIEGADMCDLDKLRVAIAWLKTCPVWQKAAAAESALDKALEVFEQLDARLDALERGKGGSTTENQGR